jgi:6,7-dimethyl-8-ribityllumazine synthase
MAKKRATARRSAKRATKRAGKPSPLRMLIVEARFYEDIADTLLKGARAVLDEAGCEYDSFTVPGALELPAAIAMAVDAAAAGRRRYDGIVALGCVIRGDTYHFEVVANESGRGLMDLAVRERLAIGNGILTVDTEVQARARAGSVSNKGADAARAALIMAQLKRDLS